MKVLTEPLPDTKVAPVYEYTDEQRDKLDALKEFALENGLPETDAYRPWELRWLNKPDTIPRYMRAAKWDLADGKKRILNTMNWRRDFKPDLIPPDEVKIEGETGKIILTGFDLDGRPILYMRPGRENTKQSPRQLRHLVWCLERAKDLQPAGQESIVILVDYKSTTLRTNPSISIARKVLTILQQHYVETLGRAMIVNLPMLLNFFYKGISPFLDPVTRDKMRFNPDLLELIPAAQLDAAFGGEYEYEWDFEEYWKQIVEKCHIAPDGTRTNEDLGPAGPPGELPPLQTPGHSATPSESSQFSARSDDDSSIATPTSALSEKFAEMNVEKEKLDEEILVPTQ